MVQAYGAKSLEEKPVDQETGLKGGRIIILFCWFFILGVSLATISFRGLIFRGRELIPPESFLIPPRYLPLAWVAMAILAALSALFFYRRRKWATHSLIILALLLGVTGYTRHVDTSSPHHLTRFWSRDFGDRRAVVGRIWQEPEVRYHTHPETGKMVERDTRLVIRPTRIQREPPDGPLVERIKGDILVTIRPELGDIYGRLSSPEALGYTVRLYAPLFEPPSASNPGTFDYKQHLASLGIYATSSLRFPRPPPLEILKETRGRLFVEAALNIKDRMLAVIRRTMPYPESAFLGGVTLGLRHGLMDLHYGGHRLNVGDAFRWAGTFHVLAVSGLHVTVIAGLLFGFFLLFIKSRGKAASFTIFFLVFFALLLFTILTGARPSSMRAFIMASIVLLFWALGSDLRYSILLSIPIAASLILLHNPLLLIEPGFTLSFGAVLSLGLITGPTMKYLRKLKGLPSVAILVIALVFPVISYFQREAFQEPHTTGQFILFAFLFLSVAYLIQRRHHLRRFQTIESIIAYREMPGGLKSVEELARVPGIGRGTFLRLKEKIGRTGEDINTISPQALGNLMRGGPLFRFGLGDESPFFLARWFFAFLGAQVAINLGMMLPLSLLYFGRLPYAGPYANFIAIPLITIIIPLAIIASILGMLIPGLGLYLALLINAGNWLLVRFFFWLSYVATDIFRYPFEKTPTGYQLAGYFSLLLVYVYFSDLYQRLFPPRLKSIKERIKGAEPPEEIEKLKSKRRNIVKGRILAGIVVGLVAFLLFIGHLSARREPVLKVTYLSAGYGDTILIQTPQGKNILIDGGYRAPDQDPGERTIAPFLVGERIRRLDTVLLTIPRLEHIGGLISIMENFEVNLFIDGLGPDRVSPEMSYDQFLTLLNDEYFLENRHRESVRQTYETYLRLLNVLRERQIPHKKGGPGTIIASERFRGRDLELYLLNPVEPGRENAYSNLAAHSLVSRLIYGDTTFLFTSDLAPEGEARLVASGHDLRSDILQVPAHGSIRSSTPSFLRAVNPRVAVISYGSAQFAGRDRRETWELEREMEETMAMYQGKVERVYNTCRFEDTAVIITSDGENYTIETMRGRARHEEPFVMRGN